MDVGDGGCKVLAGGVASVDVIMLCMSAFFFGIHMSFVFLLIGFCWMCIFVHSLIGFFFFAICPLEET